MNESKRFFSIGWCMFNLQRWSIHLNFHMHFVSCPKNLVEVRSKAKINLWALIWVKETNTWSHIGIHQRTTWHIILVRSIKNYDLFNFDTLCHILYRNLFSCWMQDTTTLISINLLWISFNSLKFSLANLASSQEQCSSESVLWGWFFTVN